MKNSESMRSVGLRRVVFLFNLCLFIVVHGLVCSRVAASYTYNGKTDLTDSRTIQFLKITEVSTGGHWSDTFYSSFYVGGEIKAGGSALTQSFIRIVHWHGSHPLTAFEGCRQMAILAMSNQTKYVFGVRTTLRSDAMSLSGSTSIEANSAANAVSVDYAQLGDHSPAAECFLQLK